MKLAVLPTVSAAMEQLIEPIVSPGLGYAQTNVGPSSCTPETKVIPAGIESVSVSVTVSSGPRFVTPTAYETSVSSADSVGPVLVTTTSENGVPVTTVAESLSGFGSVAVATLATLVNEVPGNVAAGMWKTNVKLAVLPSVNEAMVQLIVPMESPALGYAQTNVGPLFCVPETKVMPAGMASVKVSVAVSSGPRLVTLTLYGTSVSTADWSRPLLVTETSDS